MSLAFPLLHLAWNRQLDVPKDLSIVVTDDSDLFCNCSPTLSAIRQPLYQMGRRSLTKLLEMIRGKDHGEAECLPMELILRGSVAPPREIVEEKKVETKVETIDAVHNPPTKMDQLHDKLKEIEARRQFLRGCLLKPESTINIRKSQTEVVK
jgi:hypothetical protein